MDKQKISNIRNKRGFWGGEGRVHKVLQILQWIFLREGEVRGARVGEVSMSDLTSSKVILAPVSTRSEDEAGRAVRGHHTS